MFLRLCYENAITVHERMYIKRLFSLKFFDGNSNVDATRTRNYIKDVCNRAMRARSSKDDTTHLYEVSFLFAVYGGQCGIFTLTLAKCFLPRLLKAVFVSVVP